jgi:cytochrome c-type protein NapB
MNVLNTPTRPPASVRLARIVVTSVVGLAGAGCTAGGGNVAPAEATAARQADQQPAARRAEPAPSSPFALVAAEPWIPPVAQAPPDRVEALSVRAELRAFNGAPPVVPHEIDQLSATDCLRCHGDSPEADEKGAPKVPHAFLAGCTQCHVEAESEHFFETELAANTFDGLPAPHGGSRAYAGAPPLIPHTTFMRANCLSCHGPFGLPALQSSHPERQGCLQCHAVSAQLDQRAPRAER